MMIRSMASFFRPLTRRMTAATALFVCAAGLVAAGEKKKDPSAIGDRKVSGGLNFYSIEQEIALGKQLAIEVTRQARLVDDFTVSEYINRLGQNLVRNSDVTIPVSFQVIQSDEINAFTLPGGFIFVNTGLIALSGNEAQLASALAHEIGHAAARHATRQASRSRLLAIGTLPLAALGGWGGMAVSQAARIAAPMTFLKFSREFETEADMLGIQYLWKAGYDPTASIDLFEAMASTEKRQPGRVARLLRTHPVTTDRIDRTQKNIDQFLPARDEYVINTSEYEDIRQRISESGSTGFSPILRRNSR
jgi:predicted Zn-dependent protease